MSFKKNRKESRGKFI